MLSVILQGDCWRLWRGTCGWCRFLISTIDIEPLVLLFGWAFAFAPLYKFVSPFVARIVRMSFSERFLLQKPRAFGSSAAAAAAAGFLAGFFCILVPVTSAETQRDLNPAESC